MKQKARIISKTPKFFNYLKGVFATIGTTAVILSQTLAEGETLLNIDFFTSTNLIVISIVCAAIAGTSQLARKDVVAEPEK